MCVTRACDHGQLAIVKGVIAAYNYLEALWGLLAYFYLGEIGVSVHFLSYFLKPIHGKLIADGI